LKEKGIRSTHLFSMRRKYLFSDSSNQFIVSYKDPQFMLRPNSNNQIVLLYSYDNKKQTTIVLSSCHLNATVNHLRSTSTYTSYFILLLLVTKYYKSAEYVGGDSVESDQTLIYIVFFYFTQQPNLLDTYLHECHSFPTSCGCRTSCDCRTSSTTKSVRRDLQQPENSTPREQEQGDA
jgi:hypothetical protein